MRDRNARQRQRGATTVEYALLVAGMLVVSSVGISQLGSSSAGQFATAEAAMAEPECPEDWKLITTGNGSRKKAADANKDGFICRENINDKTEVKSNGKYRRNFRDNTI